MSRVSFRLFGEDIIVESQQVSSSVSENPSYVQAEMNLQVRPYQVGESVQEMSSGSFKLFGQIITVSSEVPAAMSIHAPLEFAAGRTQGDFQINSEQIQQSPEATQDVIEDVLDVRSILSRRGTAYRRYLVKWLGKPSIEATWISQEELKKINSDIYEETIKVFSQVL